MLTTDRKKQTLNRKHGSVSTLIESPNRSSKASGLNIQNENGIYGIEGKTYINNDENNKYIRF